MISSLSWVRKGFALEKPQKFDYNDENCKAFMDRAETQIKITKDRMKNERNISDINDTKININGKGLKSNMVTIHNENDKVSMESFSDDGSDCFQLFEDNLADLVVDQTDDIHVKQADIDDIDREEEEDLIIKPSDSLLLVCKTEEDLCYLEVHLYEAEQDNIFVHHDMLLSSFPLCVEWFSNSNVGGLNLAAVGLLDAQIEIWNLDIIDPPCPIITVEGAQVSDNENKNHSTHHRDSVMSISWNKHHKNALLTGSADNSVKLWDVNSGVKCIKTFSNHQGKVQCVQWNPHFEKGTLMASGSFDHTISITDVRDSEKEIISIIAGESDIECLKWNPHQSELLAYSDESGNITCFDIRSIKEPLFSIKSGKRAVTCIDWNPYVKNCLLSGSLNKSISIWNVTDISSLMMDNNNGLVLKKGLGVGKIFSTSFYPDNPYIVASAGSKGDVEITCLDNNYEFKNSFLL